MLRRALFTAITTIIATRCRVSGQTIDDVKIRQWLDFHHQWFLFLATYFGCPKDGTQFDITDCHSARGNVDYASFQRARELAKKIFDLEEKHGK